MNWPAYSPAQARVMEDALIAVYKAEARSNAGKVPNEFGDKFKMNGKAGGKKSAPVRSFVSLSLQDRVLNLVKQQGLVTSIIVRESLKVNESTARRVLRRMLDNGKLEQVGTDVTGLRVYQESEN